MAERTSTPPAGVAPEGAAGASQTPGGGLMAWLPLLVTLVTMPALAYAATTFLIVPQIQRAVGTGVASGASASAGSGTEGGAHGAPESKQTVSLNKMVVNVAGTMGTRYLLTSVTLVGVAVDFKGVVESHRDQLMDVAMSTLSNKTISELESAGARNQIRTELLSGFNQVLADGVREIYITEFAIQ